jgi:hypothetical protein
MSFMQITDKFRELKVVLDMHGLIFDTVTDNLMPATFSSRMAGTSPGTHPVRGGPTVPTQLLARSSPSAADFLISGLSAVIGIVERPQSAELSLAAR